jgi:chemotaxis protein CheD
MKQRMLNINEIDATNKPVVYKCYGLGPCIGLFVTDRQKRISGGAHIPFSPSSGTGDLCDATHLISQLLTVLCSLGSDLRCLNAKVIGGAQLFGTSDFGRKNTEAVLEQLIDHKIFIAATDVGGSVSRTAYYNSLTGELHISTSENKKYCI